MDENILLLVELAAKKAGFICDRTNVKIVPLERKNGIFNFQVLGVGKEMFLPIPPAFNLPDPKVDKEFYSLKGTQYYEVLEEMSGLLKSFLPVIAELEAHWKKMLDGAPAGKYAYGVVAFEGAPEAFSLAWDKNDFPHRVALLLGGLLPRKPFALTIFHVKVDGPAEPIIKFGQMGGDWTPPEDISEHLRTR